MKSYVLHLSSEKAAATMTKEEGTTICKSNDLATDIHSLIIVKDHLADGFSQRRQETTEETFLTLSVFL